MIKFSEQNPAYKVCIEQDNRGHWWVFLLNENDEEVIDSQVYTDDKKTALKIWMNY